MRRIFFVASCSILFGLRGLERPNRNGDDSCDDCSLCEKRKAQCVNERKTCSRTGRRSFDGFDFRLMLHLRDDQTRIKPPNMKMRSDSHEFITLRLPQDWPVEPIDHFAGELGARIIDKLRQRCGGPRDHHAPAGSRQQAILAGDVIDVALHGL